MKPADRLDLVVESVGDLPALPSVVTEVLRLTDDPNSDTTMVSNCIQSDPALTAKVLRVSNSSYYGMKEYVGTLKLALVILGVREVRNIVLGISVFETLKSDQQDVRLAQDIWDRALDVAGLARALAAELLIGLQGEEFVAGLLSDIGVMVMLRDFDDMYPDIYREHRNAPSALVNAETNEFGFTNADVAAALARAWHLPKTLVDAFWLQYPKEEYTLAEAKDPVLASVLRLAKLAVMDDLSKPKTAASIRDGEAWGILDGTENPIPAEQRAQVLFELRRQVAAAPPLVLQ